MVISHTSVKISHRSLLIPMLRFLLLAWLVPYLLLKEKYKEQAKPEARQGQ